MPVSISPKQARLIERIAYAMKLENAGDNGIKDCLEWHEVCAALNLLVKLTK